MKTLRNSKGFTLIELVVIIVVLGILAAVAVPKYIDMKAEAGQAVAKGILASLRSANSMLWAKYYIAGTANYTMSDLVGNVQLQGGGYAFGEPAATSVTIPIEGVTYTFTMNKTAVNTEPPVIAESGHATW